MKRRIREICGMVLIGVGLIAIPLPVLPGIPLIVAGAAMLGSDHPLVRSWVAWLRRKGLWKQQETK